MLTFIITYRQLLIGVAVGIFIGASIGYVFGTQNGKRIAAVDAMESTIENLKTRDKIDEKISRGDAVSLCGSLGLSDDDQRECLRRLEEANAKS